MSVIAQVSRSCGRGLALTATGVDHGCEKESEEEKGRQKEVSRLHNRDRTTGNGSSARADERASPFKDGAQRFIRESLRSLKTGCDESPLSANR
ncbi:MAG: hypothetical protein SFV21_05985 [Rhodospirillaceae bacterium]|nr:hypothetical protein [Rhodospirillaceae bacterium]